MLSPTESKSPEKAQDRKLTSPSNISLTAEPLALAMVVTTSVPMNGSNKTRLTCHMTLAYNMRLAHLIAASGSVPTETGNALK